MTPQELDKFLFALGRFANVKKFRKIEIVSCFYSFTFTADGDFTTFFLLHTADPEVLLFPLFTENRYILAVFYFDAQKVAFFDSLHHGGASEEYYAELKAIIKSKFEFAEIPPSEVGATINEQRNPEFADFHICRIAEEICLRGKNQRLSPFELEPEVERIKNIFTLISSEGWDLQWIPTLQFEKANFYYRPTHRWNYLIDRPFNVSLFLEGKMLKIKAVTAIFFTGQIRSFRD